MKNDTPLAVAPYTPEDIAINVRVESVTSSALMRLARRSDQVDASMMLWVRRQRGDGPYTRLSETGKISLPSFEFVNGGGHWGGFKMGVTF